MRAFVSLIFFVCAHGAPQTPAQPPSAQSSSATQTVDLLEGFEAEVARLEEIWETTHDKAEQALMGFTGRNACRHEDIRRTVAAAKRARSEYDRYNLKYTEAYAAAQLANLGTDSHESSAVEKSMAKASEGEIERLRKELAKTQKERAEFVTLKKPTGSFDLVIGSIEKEIADQERALAYQQNLIRDIDVEKQETERLKRAIELRKQNVETRTGMWATYYDSKVQTKRAECAAIIESKRLEKEEKNPPKP
jgi:vacuolar-type H+-ATPase subunit I/STV1